jgi:diguanylate cyclase
LPYLCLFGREQEMGSTKVKKPLQLIKSINPRKSTQKNTNKENSVCINDYYDRIEHYAQQIRSTDDLIEIINILDVALLETRNLHHSSNEVNKAQEQVQRTEQDIVALKNELEILKELVHTDQSTGALNRRGLDTSLLRESTHADQNNISLCLVLLELDDFKLFNDIYGHQAGDQALMYLVNIIKKSLRPSDIIARFGREEFVLLLSNTTMELAKLITKRLQDNLAENHLLDADQSIPITFSAGVAERTRYEHQNSVIGRAKRALYPTKNTGKNQIVAAGRN